MRRFLERLFPPGKKGAKNKLENPPQLFRMPNRRIKIVINGALFNATPKQIEQAEKAGVKIKNWRPESKQEEKIKNYQPGDIISEQGRKRKVKESGILGRSIKTPEEENKKKES